LIPRLKSRDLQRVGDGEPAIVERSLRGRDELGERNTTLLCCASIYVAPRVRGAENGTVRAL